MLIEPWMGDIVRELHMRRITQRDLAEEIGVTHQYISMVLSGAKKSETIEKKIRDAIERIEEKRANDG